MNPVTDVVVMLSETPFRRLRYGSKNDLLKVGRPIPILSVFAPDKKLSKVFCRSFDTNLYQQHLSYVEVIIYKNCFVGRVC